MIFISPRLPEVLPTPLSSGESDAKVHTFFLSLPNILNNFFSKNFLEKPFNSYNFFIY